MKNEMLITAIIHMEYKEFASFMPDNQTLLEFHISKWTVPSTFIMRSTS